MASRLKVRLDDGSEVGPLDLGMLQTWFQKGLIVEDTKVQGAGHPRWIRLAEAVDLKQWHGPVSLTARARGRSRPEEPEDPAAGASGGAARWRLVAAAVLFFAMGLVAAMAAVWPHRVRPELDGAPWRQIALGAAALGLALAGGWEIGRRAVRLAALALAVGAFPLAGLFVARGMRGEALLVVASAWLLAAGVVAFLAPELSALEAAAALLLVVLSAAGVVWFGRAETSAAPSVETWVTGEQQIVDPSVGLTIPLPPGWVALRPGNPIVPAPPTARATLAQPRIGGYAFVVVEPAPAGILLLEHYLDLQIAQRRQSTSSFEEEWRRDGRLGSVECRRARTRRESPQGRFVEQTTVARDGDRYLAIVAGVPEAGGGRALEELRVLEGAASLSGVKAP